VVATAKQSVKSFLQIALLLKEILSVQAQIQDMDQQRGHCFRAGLEQEGLDQYRKGGKFDLGREERGYFLRNSKLATEKAGVHVYGFLAASLEVAIPNFYRF
jgi:hypothetical protein